MDRRRLQELFGNMVRESYPELAGRTHLVLADTGSGGYSSPFTGDVHLNIVSMNEHGLETAAIIGIISHELGHQISYKKRSYLEKWAWLWKAGARRGQSPPEDV